MRRIAVGDTVEFTPSNSRREGVSVLGRVVEVYEEISTPNWLLIERLDERWLRCFRYEEEVRRVEG